MAYVIVDGIVDRTFYEGKGVAFHEEFQKRDGSTGKAYYSAFANEPHGLAEGDKATFKGNLSVKVREYEAQDGTVKTTADVTLNNVKIERQDSVDSDSPF